LISDRTTFEQLTTTEQILWTRFETTDIYRFLTGEEDTVPEFQFNWTSIPRLQPLGPTVGVPATPAPAQAPTPPEVPGIQPPAPASPPDNDSGGVVQLLPIHHTRHPLRLPQG
jgi:hypothetical protein